MLLQFNKPLRHSLFSSENSSGVEVLKTSESAKEVSHFFTLLEYMNVAKTKCLPPSYFTQDKAM